MKKKAIIALTTASLILSTAFINTPLVSAVYASEQQQNIDKLKEKIEKSKKIELSLEDIITLATQDNSNLMRLHYTKKLLELNQSDLLSQRSDLQDALKKIDDARKGAGDAKQKLEALRDEIEKDPNNPDPIATTLLIYINEQLAQLDGLDEQYDSINKNIDSMTPGIIDLESQINQNPLQRENVVEGVRLMVNSTYSALQELSDGITLSEKQLQQKQKELKKYETLYKVGRASSNEITKIKREIESQQQELEQLKEQYDQIFNNLLLDLNISTAGKQISIKPLKLNNLRKVRQTKTTENLIENSIAMRLLQEELKALEKQRDASTGNKREQYEVNIDMKKLDIKDKKTELEKKIKDLYLQADHAYDAMKQKEKEMQYANEDYRKLSVQHELGLISAYDFEQAKMAIDAAQIQYNQAQLKYYMVLEQIKALERGFIS